MADMVQPINGNAETNEMLHHIHGALAVGTQTMNQQHKRLGISVWEPSLVIGGQITNALEIAVLAVQNESSD